MPKIKDSMRATLKDKGKKGEFDINMLKRKYRQYVNQQVINNQDYVSYEEWLKQQNLSD